MRIACVHNHISPHICIHTHMCMFIRMHASAYTCVCTLNMQHRQNEQVVSKNSESLIRAHSCSNTSFVSTCLCYGHVSTTLLLFLAILMWSHPFPTCSKQSKHIQKRQTCPHVFSIPPPKQFQHFPKPPSHAPNVLSLLHIVSDSCQEPT